MHARYPHTCARMHSRMGVCRADKLTRTHAMAPFVYIQHVVVVVSCCCYLRYYGSSSDVHHRPLGSVFEALMGVCNDFDFPLQYVEHNM
jgi:hypothetical protein